MKRVPIERKSPLLRSSFLPQQGPSREQRPERTPQKTRGSRRDTGPSHAVRALVAARDEGRCLMCGGEATNIHHRRNRGLGNGNRAVANLPSNLISLCGSGTTGCHGSVTNPAGAGLTLLECQSNGWCLSTNSIVDSATVPVLTWRGWVMLDDAGGVTDALPTEWEES